MIKKKETLVNKTKSMFKRIKTLTLLQLGGRKKQVHTRGRAVANTIIKIGIVSLVTALMYFLFNFANDTLFFPINKSVLTFMLYVSQYIGIITCTWALMSILYNSKDNSILLSYPAKHNEVFVSKLVVAYIGEFMKNLYFVLPLFISFGILNSQGAWYYISSILMLVIIPVFPVFIGALLSIPLSYVKKLLQKCPILYVVLILGFIIGTFFVVLALVNAIPKPLRLVAMYTKFVNGFMSFVASANKFALFYIFITNIMYSANVLLNLLWLVLIMVGVVVLTNYVSMPLYFSLASKANEHSTKAKKKFAKSSNQKPTLYAFISKEIKLTFRNFNKVINDYTLIIAMPIVLFIMNAAFSAIPLTTLGKCMVTGFNVIVGLSLATACNTQSATAITVEGGEFVLLKTAPSKTSNMVWAKLIINFVVSTVFIVFSAMLMSISKVVTIDYIWPICLIMSIINWSHILWSFQLDIINPRLRDYAETGKIDGNPNANKSVIIGLLMSVIIGVITILLMFDAIDISWYKLILIALAFFGLRLFLFVKNLRVLFKRIEY